MPTTPKAGPGPAPPAAATARAGRRLRAVLAAAAAVALVVGGLWAVHGRDAPAASSRVAATTPRTTLDGREAELMARRVSAAHADVIAVWRHDFRWRLGRAYLPPELVTFATARPSPCAGVRALPGPFYCALDRTLALDLAFLGRLETQLRSEGKRAIALVVARLGAEHVQGELAIAGDADRLRQGLTAAERRDLDAALVLQADCLAGVWARRAESRIGAVEPGAWGRVVSAARLTDPDAAASARLDLGSVDDRETAFAAGYEDAQIRACLTPELSGVLGSSAPLAGERLEGAGALQPRSQASAWRVPGRFSPGRGRAARSCRGGGCRRAAAAAAG
jgi:uncharacterized protein